MSCCAEEGEDDCGAEDDDLSSNIRSGQVWSLTQFYSVDFSESRVSERSAFSTNAQSKFASAAFDRVLGQAWVNQPINFHPLIIKIK